MQLMLGEVVADLRNMPGTPFICSICHRPVELQDHKIASHGLPVHAECAKKVEPEPPKPPKNLPSPK